MAITGQKFKFYPEELKKEVVRMHVVKGWAYRRVNEPLGNYNPQRMKKWMRNYREQGEFGLLNQRVGREEYIDQDQVI